MRRRLYCLLPNLSTCREAVSFLRDTGLEERFIHVVASKESQLTGLPAANVIQKTELSYGLEMGASIGGLLSLIGGLLIFIFPFDELTSANGNYAVLFLSIVLSGTLAGALLLGLLSAQIPHRSIRVYKRPIAQGEVLLMLDVPTHQIKLTCKMIEMITPYADITLTPAALQVEDLIQEQRRLERQLAG